jgi:hypothetical protein
MQDEQARSRLEGAAAPSSEILDKLWYAHAAGKTCGPFSGHEIKSMAARGRITSSDFLCPEGGSAWTEAENEPSLGFIFRSDALARVPTMRPPAAPPPGVQRPELPSALMPAIKTIPQAETRVAKIFGRSRSAVFQRPDQDRVREDLSAYFGPRAEKYLGIYERMRAGETRFSSPNWIVLVTGFPWYFYRKMYITGTLLIFLPPLLSYLFGLTGNAGIAAGLCVTANRQYVLSAIKRIEKVDALKLIGDERRDYLRRAGGVSVVAGTLSGILCAVVFALAIAGAFLTQHKAIH